MTQINATRDKKKIDWEQHHLKNQSISWAENETIVIMLAQGYETIVIMFSLRWKTVTTRKTYYWSKWN